MHSLCILLLVVVVASPAEMKTVEELEQELNLLKMKLDGNDVKMRNIETKTEKIESKTEKIEAETKMNTENIKANMNEKNGNDTEDRLSYLEEMIKLNVIRTCEEMLQFGIKTSNYYYVDSDGPLTGSPPFRVFCEFTEDGRAITEVLHNSEQAMEVEKCETPGCYKHDIVYAAPADQIQALIQLSEECQQSIKYDCLLAPLMDNNINFGFWNDKEGDPQYYWEGSHHGEHVCSCYYQEDGCFEQSVKNTSCNCDAGVPEMKMDSGIISNKTALPISSLQFGGLVYPIQQAFHTLGRLRCWGKAAYEEGTSCVAIKRSGQFHSGFYNVRENEADNTDLVFCNLTKSPGYGQNDGGQTFIESSETHFEQVEEDITKVNADISIINEDISQIEEDIVKVNEDIGNIKHDVAMRSSYCGFQSVWKADSTIITYEKLTLEDNNIPGASLDASSGRYTAGTAGTYEVDLGIGYMWSNNDLYNDMHIRLNEVNIAESRIASHIYTSSASYEVGGRSMMIQMNKGDTVSVYGNTINDMGEITFCVKLITAST